MLCMRHCICDTEITFNYVNLLKVRYINCAHCVLYTSTQTFVVVLMQLHLGKYYLGLCPTEKLSPEEKNSPENQLSEKKGS